MDQPGKVANPARGQLNRENNIPLSPCVPENLVSRDGFSRPVPRQPAHLHTQAESGAYLRDSSRVPRRRPMKPPYAIGSVPSLSGHAIAYRWRSLPRVCRPRSIFDWYVLYVFSKTRVGCYKDITLYFKNKSSANSKSSVLLAIICGGFSLPLVIWEDEQLSCFLQNCTIFNTLSVVVQQTSVGA